MALKFANPRPACLAAAVRDILPIGARVTALNRYTSFRKLAVVTTRVYPLYVPASIAARVIFMSTLPRYSLHHRLKARPDLNCATRSPAALYINTTVRDRLDEVGLITYSRISEAVSG